MKNGSGPISFFTYYFLEKELLIPFVACYNMYRNGKVCYMFKKENNQDKWIIDNLRILAIDMIDAAGSGHPGIVLSAAPILYTLYSKHMNINVNDDKWMNRDRFVLSAGHGSALYYALLSMAGYTISIENLQQFRKLGSKTPGHPEYGLTPGVDMTTGPLGQGIASAVGMAIGERMLASTYNNRKSTIFDFYTYVLCSDGDLMEGISYEATSLAGKLKLGKLIVLYDSNDVSLDEKLDVTFQEDVLKRFEALGWHTQLVKDGENVQDIDKAIIRAKSVTDKPSLIQVKTILGKGTSVQGTPKAHGTPLSKEDITKLKESYNVRQIPFTVSKEATDNFRKMINDRCLKLFVEWNKIYTDYISESADAKKELDLIMHNNFKCDITKLPFEDELNMMGSMRIINGSIMNKISSAIPNLVGGAADLSSSTKTFLDQKGIFSPANYAGKNIYFGVREHAMGAIVNGLASIGFRPFCSTFLTFSDYMKPSIRLAAMMELPITYVFTHDSIDIGQDGPTHQPIEQLAMLRNIPGLRVFRPADAKEIIGAWNMILNHKGPSALVISRNDSVSLETTNPMGVFRGGYLVKKENGRLAGTIIATGNELPLALEVARALESKGLQLRVVSMPSIEVFFEQEKEYQSLLIPKAYKTFVIEAGSSMSWYPFVTDQQCLITIDEFGKSGKSEEVMDYFGFSVEKIINKIEKLL